MKYKALTRRHLLRPLAACALLLSACGAGDADLSTLPVGPSTPGTGAQDPEARPPSGAPSPVASARERLAGGVAFAPVPAGGRLDLHARAEGMPEAARATLPVQAGRLAVRAHGGQATLDALSLVLGDVTVPLPGLDPLVLRDVRLELAAPIDVPARFPDEDTLWVSAQPAFVLVWSLVAPSGRTVALGPQRLVGITLSMQIQSLRNGRLEARLGGRGSGLLWQWAEVLSLSDLLLDVTFVERGVRPVRPVLEAPPAR